MTSTCCLYWLDDFMRRPWVRAEFSLTALAYNLRRVLTILGVGPLLTAMQG